jgi:CopG family nickel-responsive transcriptional regulator
VHLDHNNCLEVIAVNGNAADVEKLSTGLKVLVGVKHVSLSVSSAE